MMHARWINGNLAYWDTHENRIVDAIGPTVCKLVEDFVNPAMGTDAISGWTTTLVEAGGGESTVALTDALGGKLLITTDANEDDGAQLQKQGECFQFSASKPCYFGVKLQTSEATQSDLLVGLATTDTTLIASIPADGAWFQKHDGDVNIDFISVKNTTATTTDTTADLADATDVTLEFYFDGASTIYAYVDGTLQVSNTTNICDDELLTPSIAYLAGSAGAKTLTVSWIRAIQFN